MQCYKIRIISYNVSRILSFNNKSAAHKAKNSINGGGENSINAVTYAIPESQVKVLTLKTLRKSNDLLAVLHTSLHAHRVSLRARGPIALAWVSRALLGP